MASALILICKDCGGSKLKPDTHGALEILVCEDCGTYTEAQLGGNADEYCPSVRDLRSIADGPTHHGKFYAPTVYRREKERKFTKLITEMASNVRLPEHETKLCIEEGIALLQAKKIGFNMKKFAAGLVFIALQRTSATVSYKDVEKLVNVKYTVLCRTVKQLKQLPQVSRPNLEVSDAEKMQEAVDKLPSGVSREVRVEAKKLALELKELCKEVKVQGFFICSNQTADYALLVIAMESISKQSRDGKWVELLAKEAHVTVSSLNTRLWQLKSALVKLAQKLPSIGSKVDSKEITTRNILKYISLIVKNKNFFLIDPDRQNDEDHHSEGTSSSGGPTDSYQPLLGSDDEGNLSDLDPEIDEYIVSANEVTVKKIYGDPSY